MALCVKFSADGILNFRIFPRKHILTFHANCHQWILFSRKIKKNFINVSSAELAQRVVTIKSDLVCYSTMHQKPIWVMSNEKDRLTIQLLQYIFRQSCMSKQCSGDLTDSNQIFVFLPPENVVCTY